MSGIGDCSIREAIIYANAHPGSTISLLPGTYTLAVPPTPPTIPPTPNATSGSLKILSDTRIIGPATIDGDGLDSVWSIGSGVSVVMKDLTVRDGHLEIGSGGGIQNRGALTLVHCMIMDNYAGTGGGIANWPSGKVALSDGSVVSGNTARYGGGGIAGDVTVIDSTIRNNAAPMGGGIDGGATIMGSTISDNTAEYGSAIRNFYDNAGPLMITNSTISGNKGNGSVIHAGNLSVPARLVNVTVVGNDGGVDSITYGPHQETVRSTIILRGTILANSGPNCGEGDIRSDDDNLISDTSCNFTGQHDLQGVDPMLGPLADNGGPTFTHAPLPGSPAIAAEQCTDPYGTESTLTDQRGMARPQASACTIGAYEITPV